MICRNLTEPPESTETITTFRGYNHNLRIGKGEFYEMENLTAEGYPLLCPRKPRGFYTGGSGISSLIAKDRLCYADGTVFVVGDQRVELGLTPGEKKLVSMGAYVVIFPDGKYINTADVSDRGSLSAEVTTLGAVEFTLCQESGEGFSGTVISDTEPQDISAAPYWLDTGSTPNALKQYSTASGMWVTVPSTFVKIAATGIGVSFAKGDGVTLSGLKDGVLVDAQTGQTLEDACIRALEGNFVVKDRGEDFLMVTGLLTKSWTLETPVTVKRSVPKMDFVMESGNRLWGCFYGTGEDGQVLNEIYASKLGDFKNWNCFAGVSTDSYRASCGTDGPWTGAISYLGYPLFFKEECLHRVTGGFPANFQIRDTVCQGVQKGSGKSLAQVGERLYYKSRLGICTYDGAAPVTISQPFGNVAYGKAVGGGHGSCYYISMADSENKYHLFCYDTSKGLWHRQDSTKAVQFASWNNDLYFLDAGDGCIKTMLGSGAVGAEKVSWMAQTGLIGGETPEKKFLSRLQMRMLLEPGSELRVFVEYDSDGVWKQVLFVRGTSLRSFSVPIRPRRCDHLRLRLEGWGNAKIFSVAKTMAQGSGD